MSPGLQERGALAHLSNGFRVALSRPRVVICLLALSLFSALPVAVPVYHSASAALGRFSLLGNSLDLLVSAPRWVLDAWFHPDEPLKSSTQALMAPLLLMTSLFGLLVTAGWMVCALEGKGRHALSTFFEGGGHWFFPFLRTWIFGLGLYALNTWVIWGTPGDWVVEQFLPDGESTRVDSENTGRWITNIREIIFLVALLKIEIILDLARACMVVRESRSALGGFLRAIGIWIRCFPRIFRLVGVGYALEALWIAGSLSVVSWQSWPMVSLVFLLPFGRIVCRSARLCGLATFVREQIRQKNQKQTPLPDILSEAPFVDGTAWGEPAEDPKTLP